MGCQLKTGSSTLSTMSAAGLVLVQVQVQLLMLVQVQVLVQILALFCGTSHGADVSNQKISAITHELKETVATIRNRSLVSSSNYNFTVAPDKSWQQKQKQLQRQQQQQLLLDTLDDETPRWSREPRFASRDCRLYQFWEDTAQERGIKGD